MRLAVRRPRPPVLGAGHWLAIVAGVTVVLLLFVLVVAAPLTITGVSPDSPLAAAGVGIDDVLVGYQHGIETGFYGDLEQVVAGHDAVVRLIARSEWHRGYEAWRPVRIEGSARACD
jgi:hypothetical protein